MRRNGERGRVLGKKLRKTLGKDEAIGKSL